MKRMLRWRFRRIIATLISLAMMFPLGEAILSSAFVPAANAAPARKKSVVVFDFNNKSSQGGEGLARAFTKQLRLVIDQSPAYDLVTYAAAPPYSASIERAIKEQRLQESELTAVQDPATAVKIAQILGADYALVGDIDEDGYAYDSQAKTVTIKATAMLYNAATGEPTNSVTATGVGSGEGLQGVLEVKARQQAAQIIEAKLAGRSIDNGSAPKAGRKKSILPYVVGGIALAVLAATLGGGSSSAGPAGPGALSVSATRDGVLLSWVPSSDNGVTGYRISRAVVYGRSDSSNTYTTIATVPATQSQYTDQPSVVANVRYLYRVIAMSGDKEGTAVQASRSIVPGEPSIVSGLQATVSERTVQLSWTASTQDFVTGYRVYRSELSNGVFTAVGNVSSSTHVYTDSGLTGGKTYFYKVTALGENSQESDLSLTTAVSASSSVNPSAPRNVTATCTLGSRQIVVSWQASTETDVLYYQVYRGYSRNRSAGSQLPVNIWSKYPSKLGTRGGPYQVIADHVTGNSVTDTAVDFNNTYYYVVRAVSAQGESAYSQEVSASPNRQPGVVQNVAAQAGDMVVTVTWAPLGESDIQGYNIYRQVVGQDTKTKVNDTVVTDLQYQDRTVSNDTSYNYFVTAIDNSNEEGPISSPAGPVVPTTQPTAPTNLRASASNGKVTLIWTPGTETNLKEYRIYRSDSPTMTPMLLGSVSSTQSMYADSTAQNLVTYYYEVTAVNTSGVESDHSSQVTATPNVPPMAPDNVQAIAGTSSVTVTWNPVTKYSDGRDLPTSMLKGYRVYRTLTTTGAQTLIKELTIADLQGQPKYEDRTAPSGVPLTYAVTAIMLDSNEAVLESAQGVPADTTPIMVVRRLQPPTGLTAATDDNRVTLSWMPSSDTAALGYVIYGSTSVSGPFTRLFTPLASDGQPVLPASAAQFAVTNQNWTQLRNDTRYWFKIATVDKLGVEGIQSDAIEAIPNPQPLSPLNVVASNVDGAGNPLDMEVNITWAPPQLAAGQTIAGYRVLRSSSATGPFEVISSTPVVASPMPSFKDTFTTGSVSPSEAKDQDFYYQVVTLVQYPVAGLVESQPTTAPIAARVVDLVPPAVSLQSPTVTNGMVTLRWSEPKDAQGNPLHDLQYYIIERKLQSDVDWSAAVQTQVNAGTTFYQDTNVTSGDTYEYRIEARDYTNEGPWSAVQTATIP